MSKKTILITGASSDIALKLIDSVKDNYSTIIAHYNHKNEQLESIKNKCGDKILPIQADLSKSADVENLINQIETLNVKPNHIVHFAAPKFLIQKFSKTDWNIFENLWKVSFSSIVKILKAFLPDMQKQKYGKIIFMLTSCTLGTPPKCQSAYTSVKYALLGLMKSLASEYGDYNICINGVSPDMIQTKFLSELPELLIEKYKQSKENKQLLTIEEVLPTFEYLLSDNGDSVNGENIAVL